MNGKLVGVALALVVAVEAYTETKESDELTKRMIEHRAVEAVIWADACRELRPNAPSGYR